MTNKCEQRNGANPLLELQYPVADWTKKFYGFEDLEWDDAESKELNFESQYCFKIFTCQTTCVSVNGNLVCKPANNHMASGTITKITIVGDCPDPNPVPNPGGGGCDNPGELPPNGP